MDAGSGTVVVLCAVLMSHIEPEPATAKPDASKAAFPVRLAHIMPVAPHDTNAGFAGSVTS